MRTRLISTAAAAALTIGGLGFAGLGCDKDDTRTAGQTTADAIDKAGDATGKAVDKTVDATKDAADKVQDAVQASDKPGDPTEEIHDTLARVTEAAVKDDGVDDAAEEF